MIVLVLNSGSSSFKYKLIDMAEGRDLASGIVERIGEPGSSVTHRRFPGRPSETRVRKDIAVADHAQGLKLAVSLLVDCDVGCIDSVSAINAVGHRIVHGGELFRDSVRIDQQVIAGIRANIPLAPLHNPGCLMGVESAMALLPTVPHVAVFDTAFHSTIPPHAYHYAVPYSLYEELGIRRYGFHGTSHRFVSSRAAELLGKSREECNLITLHLGNGASITAIRDGRSVDTSMGMTPLDGVIMGTRSGAIDPAIIPFLAERKGWTVQEIDTLLSKESGLKGICGASDMRDIHAAIEQGDARARLALDMLVYRYRMFLGAYFAVLGRVDAVVFTGGIGEKDPDVRNLVCQGLEPFGVTTFQGPYDEIADGAYPISTPDSRVKVFVIATNEELEIATQTLEVLNW